MAFPNAMQFGMWSHIFGDLSSPGMIRFTPLMSGTHLCISRYASYKYDLKNLRIMMPVKRSEPKVPLGYSEFFSKKFDFSNDGRLSLM